VHGKALFSDVKVGCVRCHRIQGQGGQIGPDLAGIGTKYGRPSLIEAVLYPSRQIAEGYAQTLVRTSAGSVPRAWSAPRRPTNSRSWMPREAAPLRKTEIDARRLGERSLMPDGLQASMTPKGLQRPDRLPRVAAGPEGFVPLFNGKDLGGWKRGRSTTAIG